MSITEHGTKKTSVCLALLTSTLPVPAVGVLPSDVRKFVDRREGCDHMRGELPDPSEKQRMNDVNREIERLCKGTDKQLARLKRKYASSGPVMQRLREFEEGIEAGSAAPGANTRLGRQAG